MTAQSALSPSRKGDRQRSPDVIRGWVERPLAPAPGRGALTALSSVMAGLDPATQPNAQHAWEDQPVRPGPADQKPKKNAAPMLSHQTAFTVERAFTVRDRRQ